ncbi:MAG: PLP-dependent transferase [Myxococcota bacterium]|nr:PLP-dependent transferase [Myxococcota bacterium]
MKLRDGIVPYQKLTTAQLRSSGLLDFEVTSVKNHEVRRVIVHKTGLLIEDTPTNPTLRLADLSTIYAQAKNTLILVDSTFDTLTLLQPLSLGASLGVDKFEFVPVPCFTQILPMSS